jgi:chromosome partitioning protein
MRGRRRDRDQSSLRGMKGHSPLSGETDQQKALPEDGVLSEEALPEEVGTRTEVAPQAAPTPVAEPAGVPAGPSGEGESEPVPAAEADPDPATEKQPEPVPAAEIAPPATEQLAAKAEPALVEASQTVGSEQNADAEPVEVANGRMVQAASGNPLPRILAIANQKGGVGKTTTSVNLGAALAELGFRILVIDLDPQGNATTGLGIDARNFERSMYDVLMRDTSLEDCIEPTSTKNLFVAPSTIDLAGAEIELVPAFSRETKLKRAIETVIDDFDFILIDCPPSLGLITVNGLAAAGEVLVPVQCEYYALEGLTQLMRNVHLVASNLNAGLDVSTVVLTMYDARTKLSDQVAQEVRQHFGNKVCRSVIPRTVRLSEAPSFGQPITAFDPTSRGAIAYRELAKEVSGGAS